ncbi:MAG: glycoside hydrolase family 2, partial [Bacteroidota bacterium]|nr:glycoside hydrolase family 2 [Bacteroidota bacterium]
YQFNVEKRKGKKVFIVFEGSMTDTKVMINGQQAGPVHQGGFYRFKYDITGLLKADGKNLLEVTVDKTSANASVNSAERDSDFWIFGGIFRPVYLEIVPETFID